MGFWLLFRGVLVGALFGTAICCVAGVLYFGLGILLLFWVVLKLMKLLSGYLLLVFWLGFWQLFWGVLIEAHFGTAVC